MTKVIFTENDFVHYARCPSLFKKSYTTQFPPLEPGLISLAKRALKEYFNHKELAQDITIAHTTQDSISEQFENKVLCFPRFNADSLLFTPHIIDFNADTIDVYILCQAYSINNYFIKQLSIWFFGLHQLGFKNIQLFSLHISQDSANESRLIKRNLTLQATKKSNSLTSDIQQMKHVVNQQYSTTPSLVRSCFKPHRCNYFESCWKTIDNPSLLTVNGLSFSDKLTAYKKGLTNLSSYHDTHIDFSELQHIQINSELNNKPHIEHAALREFFDTLNYPLQCFDIETVTYTVSPFEPSCFFQKIPFLFSCHTLYNFDAPVSYKHTFLDPIKDPRRLFAEQLLSTLSYSSSIIVYDAMLETQIIKQLATMFPDLSSELHVLLNHIVDISYLFKNLKLYIPAMQGRFSLKAIHHALKPHSSHESLRIKSGFDVSTKMQEYGLLDSSEKQSLQNDIVEYCKMDTQAIVDMLFYIYKVIK
ncbi:hypothetical protein DID76_00855 [Candidatus Marinamargulisbacteria bacterium SCGC AG-414-C22]|nr:hypothetical protein DID76_00855 [Candidatus Marinamargulisbacteria bacterium SCGC AG-414-C22]